MFYPVCKACEKQAEGGRFNRSCCLEVQDVWGRNTTKLFCKSCSLIKNDKTCPGCLIKKFGKEKYAEHNKGLIRISMDEPDTPKGTSTGSYTPYNGTSLLLPIDLAVSTPDEQGNVSKVFSYIIAQDTTLAPAVHKGLLSLLLCKWQIRDKAVVGDWVIAFMSKSIHGKYGLIRYIFKVTETQTLETYYGADCKRPDKIYSVLPGGKLQHRHDTLFHDCGDKYYLQEKDMKGHALLSDIFKTFSFANPLCLPSDLLDLGIKGIGKRTTVLSKSIETRLFDIVNMNPVNWHTYDIDYDTLNTDKKGLGGTTAIIDIIRSFIVTPHSINHEDSMKLLTKDNLSATETYQMSYLDSRKKLITGKLCDTEIEELVGGVPSGLQTYFRRNVPSLLPRLQYGSRNIPDKVYSGKSNPVYTEYKGQETTFEYLDMLPSGYIGDEHMNSYLAILRSMYCSAMFERIEKDGSIYGGNYTWLYDTFFWVKLVSFWKANFGKKNVNMEDKRVLRWMTGEMKMFMRDDSANIMLFKKWIIPVHKQHNGNSLQHGQDEDKDHWLVVVVDFLKKRFKLYDSLGRAHDWLNILKIVAFFVQKVIKEFTGKSIDTKSWKFWLMETAEQRDGDCGVHMAVNIHAILLRLVYTHTFTRTYITHAHTNTQAHTQTH